MIDYNNVKSNKTKENFLLSNKKKTKKCYDILNGAFASFLIPPIQFQFTVTSKEKQEKKYDEKSPEWNFTAFFKSP